MPPVPLQQPQQGAGKKQPDTPVPRTRLRKPHRKSRRGCANCKLRRVKCDETKPDCLKCVAFGVGCSYDPGAPEMQLTFAGTFRVDLGQSAVSVPKPLEEPPFYLPLAGNRPDDLYELNSFDRVFLGKFKDTTILTVGPKEASVYFQQTTLKLAYRNPYLMHIVLSLAVVYDMHVTGERDNKKQAALAFHSYHGATLYNQRISTSTTREEKDALWAAAALTGSCNFADISARAPSEAWPMSPPSPSDLYWLKLTGGKTAVFDIVEPYLEDSLFHAAQAQIDHSIPPIDKVGDAVRNLPPKFIELYNLDENSTPENNPYHCAAITLAHLMPLTISRINVPKFLCFTRTDARFPQLLMERDPGAILLLAYWYAKALDFQHWWMWRRVLLEGPAICMFLEKAFSKDSELLELLEFPKAAFAEAFNNPPGRKPTQASGRPAQISG
ncbi:transcription factor cys6 protein [Echria macrotheca]|uniref:Transcription factor cys6 protein n=1 Tax=Echria macrotheca TaxID=438768 RepID=A0AAJ0B9D8_9PEZI|nr:transcription factor cys6 protein [Echria macrotheca]